MFSLPRLELKYIIIKKRQWLFANCLTSVVVVVAQLIISIGEGFLLFSRFFFPQTCSGWIFPPSGHVCGTHVVLVVGRVVFATSTAPRVAEGRRRVVLQSVREPIQSDDSEHSNDEAEQQTTTTDRHEGDKQKSRVGKVRGEIPAP